MASGYVGPSGASVGASAQERGARPAADPAQAAACLHSATGGGGQAESHLTPAGRQRSLCIFVCPPPLNGHAQSRRQHSATVQAAPLCEMGGGSWFPPVVTDASLNFPSKNRLLVRSMNDNSQYHLLFRMIIILTLTHEWLQSSWRLVLLSFVSGHESHESTTDPHICPTPPNLGGVPPLGPAMPAAVCKMVVLPAKGGGSSPAF